MSAGLPQTPQFVLDELLRMQEKYNLTDLLNPQNSELLHRFMTELKHKNQIAHDYLLFPETKILDTIALMAAVTSVKGSSIDNAHIHYSQMGVNNLTNKK